MPINRHFFFSAAERWTTNPYFGTRGLTFADATGDRKADAIVVNEGQCNGKALQWISIYG
ncbi:MAG: hypothetical protein IPH31_05385 [Lewinellaceae bacterium]|nr:hypothetical protein [Lewinellaceae bacterium]